MDACKCSFMLLQGYFIHPMYGHAKIAPVVRSPNICCCWDLANFQDFLNFAIIDSYALSKYKASDFLLEIFTLLTEIPSINFLNAGDSTVDNGSISLMTYSATRVLMVVGKTDAFVTSVHYLLEAILPCNSFPSSSLFRFPLPLPSCRPSGIIASSFVAVYTVSKCF